MKRLRLAFWAFWYVLRHGELPVQIDYVPVKEDNVASLPPQKRQVSVRWTYSNRPDQLKYDGESATFARKLHEAASRVDNVIRSELVVDGVVRGIYVRGKE